MFASRFEGFDDVSLNAGVLQKYPGFIDEERFENRGNLAVGDDGIGAMQDVEEQRFQKLRVLAHPLEVEALKAGKRDRVLGIVEEKTELTTARPFRKAACKIMAERITEHLQRTECRINRVQIFI